MAIAVILIIISIFGLGIFAWIIATQRTLVTLDEMCNNALSQIDVNLASRFDALKGLLNMIKGYNNHEYKTLSDVIAMRSNGHTAKDVQKNEDILSQVTSRIVATAEAYPDLKSNENYKTMMDSINDYENKVRTSRLVYNDAVTKLNRTIRMFPTSLVAPMCGVVERDYLKTDEAKVEMPDLTD